MIIPIASDHAGYEAKEKVKAILEKAGHTVVDFGTHEESSVDYPDFAILVAESVNNGEHTSGVLVCGSGQGMCISANKFNNVRAALAWNKEIAELSKQHNNSNVLCLPGRFLSDAELEEIVNGWLSAEFEGGRHDRRVQKINTITQK